MSQDKNTPEIDICNTSMTRTPMVVSPGYTAEGSPSLVAPENTGNRDESNHLKP